MPDVRSRNVAVTPSIRERKIMMRNSLKPMLFAALVAGLSSGAAFADGDGGDNGMTPHYGDSWSNLQGHETVTVPGMEATEQAATARAQWAQARENARARMDRAKEALMPQRTPESAPAAATAPTATTPGTTY
jgi:hypothetical protein